MSDKLKEKLKKLREEYEDEDNELDSLFYDCLETLLDAREEDNERETDDTDDGKQPD